MNEKELIRDKWIRDTPLLKLNDCVDGAMKEYAKQQSIAFAKWCSKKKWMLANPELNDGIWTNRIGLMGLTKKTTEQLYDQYLIDTENK